MPSSDLNTKDGQKIETLDSLGIIPFVLGALKELYL